MGIRKRISAAKAQHDELAKADATPDNVAAMYVAEGILNLEKWRNIDALRSFEKALDKLRSN